MKVTTDDLLDALRGAMEKPADGDATTVGEIVAATGCYVGRVRVGLRALHAVGRLEVVTVRRPALDGRMQSVPGYRIKPKPKAAR